MADISQNKLVLFRVRRYDPEKDSKPHYESYPVRVEPGMTVLDGLHQIKAEQDSTLSWRYSCRMGICGSCGMMVNGKLMLACNNQILDISEKELCIAPTPNFDIVKDLVPDLNHMFEKHQDVKPYLHRKDEGEQENPTAEYTQSPEELEEYLQFSYCIRCGLCMGACPTLATDAKYLGPMPLTQAQRWNTDSRDQGFDDRKNIVGDKHGVFRCHYAGECSNVCPKGVDPGRALQHLKRQLVKDYLHLTKTDKNCELADLGAPQDKEDVPKVPDYTV